MSDLVKSFEVPIEEKWFLVDLYHNTKNGDRKILVDMNISSEQTKKLQVEIEKERPIWKMFHDSSTDEFKVGKKYGDLRGDNTPVIEKNVSVTIKKEGNSYKYSLLVEGVQLKEYQKRYRQKYECWQLDIHGYKTKVFMEINKLEVWRKGKRIDAPREFISGGSRVDFQIEGKAGSIEVRPAGKNLIHVMTFDGKTIPHFDNWDRDE